MIRRHTFQHAAGLGGSITLLRGLEMLPQGHWIAGLTALALGGICVYVAAVAIEIG